MEMALLPAAGLYEQFYVLPLWYLSALMILLPLFYYLLIKGKDAFLWVGCPICAMLIYGYFCRTVDYIDTWTEWTGLFFTSLPWACGPLPGRVRVPAGGPATHPTADAGSFI